MSEDSVAWPLYPVNYTEESLQRHASALEADCRAMRFLLGPLTHSFTCSLIHSFTHAFMHSFVHCLQYCSVICLRQLLWGCARQAVTPAPQRASPLRGMGSDIHDMVVFCFLLLWTMRDPRIKDYRGWARESHPHPSGPLRPPQASSNPSHFSGFPAGSLISLAPPS